MVGAGRPLKPGTGAYAEGVEGDFPARGGIADGGVRVTHGARPLGLRGGPSFVGGPCQRIGVRSRMLEWDGVAPGHCRVTGARE